MAGKKYSSPEVSLYQTEDILINSYNVNIGSLYALDDEDEEPEIRITDFEVADILATSGGPKDENIGEWDLF